MNRGDIIRVRIEKLAPDGTGCAVVERKMLSVKGALPGDEVDIRVLGVKRHYARVRLESVVTPGIERIPAECPHFATCGGCLWQDVSYDIQCSMKKELVLRTLNSMTGCEPCESVEFVPSPDVFFYRNKMEFSFDSPPGSQDSIKLGLHEAGKFDRVFDLTACLLQSELSNRAVEVSRTFAVEKGLTVYGLKSHVGLLRFLAVRDAKNTGELMINLVTSGDEFPCAADFTGRIVRDIPGVTTVVRSINRMKGNVAVGQERDILYGDGFICERIGGFTFALSPDSFFQTNIRQTENLYETVKQFSGLTGTEHLLDLYCGTGTIGIYLAEGTKSVTGVEMVESGIDDARRNAELNGIGSITFVAGKVEKVIDEGMGRFDVVVCDPPRAGIHPKALSQLVRMRIPRMVYVSCNIKAMPHDLETLALAGYRIKKIRVFDMSPHTPHIETVVMMEIG
ncbi:23S rRNA (uracil(1939)-C(5))-methyltransferase RlmD [Candidatus Latescibacterota bacterium]